MDKETYTLWDSAELLTDDEVIIEYLKAALEQGSSDSRQTMNIKHFRDMDTLYIESRVADIVETRDLDENMLIDLDSDGSICAITPEHASEPAGISSYIPSSFGRGLG